jgi:hypothetical protein
MQEPSAPQPRRDDLVAAAVAASEWIRRRRTAWASGGPPLAPLRVAVRKPADAPVVATLPHVSDAASTPSAPEPQPARPQEPPTPVAVSQPTAETRRARRTAKAPGLALKVVEFALTWWRPLTATIVVAVLGTGIVWGVRSGWHYVTVTLASGTVLIDSVPEGSGVSIDGIVVGQTPITRQLPVGRHTVEFHSRKETRVVMLDVSARGQNVARLDWSAKLTGHLHVESSPDGAHVLVDGSDRGVTPLTIDVPVGGHTVLLQNASGSLQRNVTIAADKTAEISEGIYAGFVHVASTIEVTISEGSRTFVQDDHGQAIVPAGSHVLQIRNRDLGFSDTRHVDVIPGEVSTIEVRPVSTLTVTSTLPGHVMIDGADAGNTPVTNYLVSLGTRDIVVRTNIGDERRASVKVTTAPARLDVDFSKP